MVAVRPFNKCLDIPNDLTKRTIAVERNSDVCPGPTRHLLEYEVGGYIASVDSNETQSHVSAIYFSPQSSFYK